MNTRAPQAVRRERAPDPAAADRTSAAPQDGRATARPAPDRGRPDRTPAPRTAPAVPEVSAAEFTARAEPRLPGAAVDRRDADLHATVIGRLLGSSAVPALRPGLGRRGPAGPPVCPGDAPPDVGSAGAPVVTEPGDRTVPDAAAGEAGGPAVVDTDLASPDALGETAQAVEEATDVETVATPPVTSDPAPTRPVSGDAERAVAAVAATEALLDAAAPAAIPETARPTGSEPDGDGAVSAGSGTAAPAADTAESTPTGAAATPETAPAEPGAPGVDPTGTVATETTPEETPSEQSTTDAATAAWAGRLQRSVHALPDTALPPPDTYSAPLRAAGATSAQTWAGRTAAVPQHVARVLKAEPIKQLRDIPQMPAPDPLPEVTERLRTLGHRELPDQTLPALLATPSGFVPTIGAPPADPSAPVPAPVPAPGGPAPVSATPVPAINRALAEPSPDVPVPGRGQTVSGSERPPTFTVDPTHHADLAAVLARVYLDAARFGPDVVRNARAQAYPGLDLGTAPTLAGLGSDLEPVETAWFEAELGRVAVAARIGMEALDAAVAARRAELDKAQQAAAAGTAAAAQEETTAVRERAATTQLAVQSARTAWDAHWDRVAAEAKGGVDPAAVRAEEARLGERLRTFTEQHVAAWSGMRTVRLTALERAAADQVIAYTEAALADESQRQQASVTELADPELVQYLRDRRREVRHALGALKEAVEQLVDGWKAELEAGRDRGIEAARVWADGRIGRERGWLDRLLARILDTVETKHRETAAVAQAQTEETVAALGTDLQVLTDLKAGGYEGLDRDSREHLGKQDAEQQKLLRGYFKGPEEGDKGPAAGDTIGYLAAMLQIRLRRQRCPEAVRQVREKVLALDDVTHWQSLEVIGRAQNPVFSAKTVADQLWAAFEHTWGTDEVKAYEAVQALTPEQGKAVRGAYRFYWKEDLEARLDAEMGGSEYERVEYALAGRQAQADAAAIRDAVQGGGTDEELINKVLRHKTAAERIAISEAYRTLYGEELRTRLDKELGGDDKAITDAHLEGNTERADAIEVKAAREAFWGPDVERMEQVFTRVRDEATTYGDTRGYTSAEIGAEIARRTGKMQVEYADHTRRGMLDDLERSLSPQVDQIADPQMREDVDQYWKGRKDLVLGLATGDLVRADAGKIQIERTGLYADDDTVNRVLGLQYERAYDRERRDALIAFAEANGGRTPTAAEMRELEAGVVRRAEAQGAASLAEIGLHVETHYTHGEPFADTVRDLTQGVGEEKADALLSQGGHLQDWQVLEFATKDPWLLSTVGLGTGTDEDAFRAVLKRARTKAEIDELERQWRANTGRTDSIGDLIRGETSGRLRNDLLLDYQYGAEPDDPQTAVQKARAQLDFERRSGGVTVVTDMWGRSHDVKNREYAVLEQRLLEMEQRAQEYDNARNQPEGPAKTWATLSWQADLAGFASGVETHRFLVDQRTELAAQVVSMATAVVVGIVITVASGGVGSVGAAALIAGVSAMFGAAAGIATKASMKGAAYGADEIGVDVAVGLVDTLISAATAGLGDKIIKAGRAAAAVGRTGAGGMLATIGRMAEGSVAKRAVAHAITEGAEGFLQSIPTAALSTALNEDTWKGNPLLNMLLGVGMGAGLGAVASGTIGAVTHLRGPKAGTPGVPDAGPVAARTALVDAREHTADLAALEAEYFARNPTRTAADFRRDFDGVLLLQSRHDPDVATRLHGMLRDEITDLLPPGQRSLLAEHPVEMWDARRFEEFTGSKSGQAVVIVKDGRTTVVVKQGAAPHDLAQEGFHLVQALDPRTSAKVARLDEAKMSRWGSLDVREKLALYREKLDLELDAQRQMVDALEDRARGAPSPELAERLTAARETLTDLEHRFVEMSRIGPLQRTLMAWGVIRQPQWLDQPARLFAKTSLRTVRRRVLRRAAAATTDVEDLQALIRQIDEALPRGRRRAMLEHLDRAFARLDLPRTRLRIADVERVIEAAADALDAGGSLGSRLTEAERLALVTRAFTERSTVRTRAVFDSATAAPGPHVGEGSESVARGLADRLAEFGDPKARAPIPDAELQGRHDFWTWATAGGLDRDGALELLTVVDADVLGSLTRRGFDPQAFATAARRFGPLDAGHAAGPLAADLSPAQFEAFTAVVEATHATVRLERGQVVFGRGELQIHPSRLADLPDDQLRQVVEVAARLRAGGNALQAPTGNKIQRGGREVDETWAHVRDRIQTAQRIRFAPKLAEADRVLTNLGLTAATQGAGGQPIFANLTAEQRFRLVDLQAEVSRIGDPAKRAEITAHVLPQSSSSSAFVSRWQQASSFIQETGLRVEERLDTLMDNAARRGLTGRTQEMDAADSLVGEMRHELGDRSIRSMLHGERLPAYLEFLRVRASTMSAVDADMAALRLVMQSRMNPAARVDPTLPPDQLVHAARRSHPSFSDAEEAAYHVRKHRREIHEPANSRDDATFYHDALDQTLREGVVQPVDGRVLNWDQFGRSRTFLVVRDGVTAFVRIQRDGQVFVSTYFRK